MSDYLCEDLIDEILVRLPPKSLRFRSVSKSWHCCISSPSFIRKHTVRLTTFSNKADIHRSLLTDKYTRRELKKFTESNGKIVGSCFGVICMDTRIYHNVSVILWNPSVRRKLTVPDYPCRSRHLGVSLGFGFDPITDDYKIVGLCVHTSFVYSIKTNSWSEIQVPTTSRFSQVNTYGCFADGTLHWVVQCETSNVSHYYILTFNLSTHVFGMISLPKPNRLINRLTFIKESLAVNSDINRHIRWLWIRREENDNVASWSNASKLKSIEVEDSKGYNPFTGVHYALEVNSYYRYKINMDICGETLELLDKEPC
ncbi:F-box/kelch-repeat protein-like protein [Tanacetum coccineum]